MFQIFSGARMVPTIISIALFMEALDSTIINTAIPAISSSLGVNPVDLKIALISYLLSLAVFIPISSWVADRWGAKRVYLVAILLFTLSSMWCGFSESLMELVIARAMQGLGGSFMLPVGRLILARTFSRSELIITTSRISMVAAIGMMLGPMLGGFITHYISWHWIFWINLPLGLFVLWMIGHLLEDMPPKPVPPLDKIGFLLFGLGLSGLTFAFSALSETIFPSKLAITVLLMSLVSLVFYVLHSYKKPYPIVKPELFQFRTFQISIMGNLLARVGFGGVPFLLALLLQVGLGYPAQISGLLLAPMALGSFIIKPLSLRILRFTGYKRLLLINTVLISISLWVFTSIDKHTSFYTIGTLAFAFGFLMGLQYTGMNSLAYADIPDDYLSPATSVISTIQQLSQSFGVAVAALFLRYFSLGGAKYFNLAVSVFQQAFWGMAFLTLTSLIIFSRLKPGDGHQMVKKKANRLS